MGPLGPTPSRRFVRSGCNGIRTYLWMSAPVLGSGSLRMSWFFIAVIIVISMCAIVDFSPLGSDRQQHR